MEPLSSSVRVWPTVHYVIKSERVNEKRWKEDSGISIREAREMDDLFWSHGLLIVIEGRFCFNQRE